MCESSVWKPLVKKKTSLNLTFWVILMQNWCSTLLWSEWLLLSCCVVFVLCHFCAVCPQGLPGLPTLAALHSNQILTVKVCWRSQKTKADSMDSTLWDVSNGAFVPSAYAMTDLAKTQLCLINPFQPIKKYFCSLWPSFPVPVVLLLCSVVTGIYASEQLFLSPNKPVKCD